MKAHLAHLGGEGPPLALIHGFGANRLFFLSLVASVSVPVAFYAVELPGHGDAGPATGDPRPEALADCVAEAIADLPAPFPVLGHSLGGAVAIQLAIRHPDLVSRLILIAPAGWGRALDTEFLRGLPDVRDGRSAQSLLERLIVRPRHIPKGLGDHVLSELSSERRDGLRRIADVALSAPEPKVPELPITLIWGDADVINPHDPARQYPDNVMQHIVSGTGHMPHVEKAGETARIVSQALA